jgi:hypothetical protein
VRGVNPQGAQRTHFHRTSANRGWRVQESHARQKSRSAIPRFDLSRRSWRDRWHKSENIGVSAFGVSNGRDFGIVDPRSAKSRRLTWQRGTRRHSGVQVAHSGEIAVSVLGDLIGKGSASRVATPRG